MIANVLTIAGSDPSGGAGIQADLKTFSAHGVYGCSVITAVTAQNTLGVQGVHTLPAEFVAAQLQSVLQDVRISAAKTGMLANAAIIRAIVAVLAQHPHLPLVVDPVMVSTSGHRLLEPEAERALREELIPRSAMITPNLSEAAVLLGREPDYRVAAMDDIMEAILGLGAPSIYLKGGHIADSDLMCDLFWDGEQLHRWSVPRQETTHTHGTGCSLAASIAAHMGRGASGRDAARAAHDWLQLAIAAATRLEVGSGKGPVNHLTPMVVV